MLDARCIALWLTVAAGLGAADGLRVVASTSDLGSIATSILGERGTVVTLASGADDPHHVDARPSFIKALNRADALVLTGMELEIGWLPPLVDNAANGRIQPGASGYIDAARFITPLGVPGEGVDRALGDVHAAGNPHYLLDPVNGVLVARGLRDAFTRLAPDGAADFARTCDAFSRAILDALVGREIVERDGIDACLARCAAVAPADAEIVATAGSWLDRLRAVRGTRAVVDHDQWPYFARRFGIEVIGALEPKAGLGPTTAHLAAIIGRMKTERVPLLIAVPYFDRRLVERVREETGARVARLAHQVGAVAEAGDYLGMCAYNVAQIAPVRDP
ncbi:MAG: zinc ABC transporter substrate-binding protein [Planctomycetes bacterium]|nr:zinc ABC transporter substrate-binding protein [Planctomycetota bacterium]